MVKILDVVSDKKEIELILHNGNYLYDGRIVGITLSTDDVKVSIDYDYPINLEFELNGIKYIAITDYSSEGYIGYFGEHKENSITENIVTLPIDHPIVKYLYLID